MTMLYIAAFSASEHALGDITISRTAHPSITVDMSAVDHFDAETNSVSANVFWHYAPAGETTSTSIGVIGQDLENTQNLGSFSRRSWGRALQADIRAAMVSAGTWTSSDFTISYSISTGYYTIAYSDTITVTFESAVGRQLLGFSADISTPAASSTGTVVPTYVYAPTLQSVSDNTPNYEPDGIANHIVTDSGRGTGLSRSTSPIYRDWRQEFETKERTMRANASSTYPWTIDHLITHCRGQYPFCVVSGFGDSFDEVFSLRSECTSFKPQRHSPGNDAQFFHEFKTVVEGTMTTL